MTHEVDPSAGKIREAAGKSTECVGKILLDLQLAAEGKIKRDAGDIQQSPDEVEQKLEDDC